MIDLPAAATGGAAFGAGWPSPPGLSGREKAAIIVRLLLSEGAHVPLQALNEDQQASLTDQMGRMGLVDRATLQAVATEFAERLGAVGLAFPQGVEGALGVMDRHISPDAAARLRRLAGIADQSDPWETVAAQETDALVSVLSDECTEIGAVILSKLPVARAAELLARLPGERARRIAVALSQTAQVSPDTVACIGRTLADQLSARPVTAFASGPAERVGAILNSTPATTRDEVLQSLDDEDGDFAQAVRRTIFTFAHIVERIEPRDVPKIARAVAQPVLVTALAGAGPREAASAEFILANMSQRLAGALREEIAALGSVRGKDAETAMAAVTAAIRDLVDAGEMAFVAAWADDEPA